MSIKSSASDRVFGAVNTALLVFALLVVLYPLYFVLIASISEPYAVGTGKIRFLPIGFTMDGYLNVFINKEIWTGYRNSMLYTVIGTLLNLFMTIPTAYALSKRQLPFRNGISIYFLFTMYFGGGMIPYYLLVKSLGLINQPYTMIILGGVSVFNIVVTRTYFQTAIPEELYEAAFIDGASEGWSFIRIAIPLAAPIISVITLYYAVGRWNDYFSALIFLPNRDYHPLQMVLRGILTKNQKATSQIIISSTNTQEFQDKARLAYIAESMKYALIYIASAPMLVLYPFVQKHFVKGVMIGSLKG